MKSNNTFTDIVITSDNDISNAINKMENGDIDTIIACANSKIPILVLNAVIFGGKHQVRNKSFIQKLKEDLLFSHITFFGKEFTDYVKNTLDLLDVH